MDLKTEKNCSDIPVVAPNTWQTFTFVTSLSRRFFVNSIDKEFSFFCWISRIYVSNGITKFGVHTGMLIM